MAKREGIGHVIYLGGLGDSPCSEHLRSRHETARQLKAYGPPLTYFRAGMVVGSDSESYRTLRYLVERLPAMIAPAWLATRTQPMGIDDVLSYLAGASRRGFEGPRAADRWPSRAKRQPLGSPSLAGVPSASGFSYERASRTRPCMPSVLRTQSQPCLWPAEV
jgi:uncharacterized protein YbjT (DUF2867 family)